MSHKEIHTVPDLKETQRLQEYAVGIFAAAYSRSALKKAIKKGYVQVDGKPATTALFIKGGERIEIEIPYKEATRRTLDLDLDILYEDDHLALIYKPAGIAVSSNAFRNIANALHDLLKPSSQKDACPPQYVHRLDYPTSGVLLIGKHRESIRRLNKMFEDREIQKRYYAVAIGKTDEKGYLDSDIDGKASETLYERIDLVPSKRFEHLSLLMIEPRTGRRHQIRKHLASMGHPVLGDKDYGKPDLILKGKGLYLHAHTLKFDHPITGETLQINAELPKKFTKIFGVTIE